MKNRVWIAAFALALTSAVGAQTAPISRTIPLTFIGVVSSTAADTMLVRQPDGSFTKFAGPLPKLAYAKGDPVTISFNATLPTKGFYDSGQYQGHIAADGIYRIGLIGAAYFGGAGPGGIGNTSITDVSGPINAAANFGQPNNTTMTVVYDYNKDSYSIEGGGNFNSSYFSGPGYVYDAASQSYVACTGSCTGVSTNDPVMFNLTGSADGKSITTGRITVNSNDPQSGTGSGFFSLLFSGSWNLPQFDGGITDVPEPGTLLLFAGATAAIMRRRRKPPAS